MTTTATTTTIVSQKEDVTKAHKVTAAKKTHTRPKKRSYCPSILFLSSSHPLPPNLDISRS